ncbi:hypothetical protein H5410_053553 [Solanum commersonii]|uniref:Uncharacterized protein n=1 Tax=Solanum commersonii TaxID=4109 RepID=A0A9J5X6Q9_SOLCO|nr:hypothetical protein H5410_053553 [Solanum commersonii]
MASTVGRPIAIDKATQDKTRPSTARVKVILDLMDKLPKRMRLQYLDEQTGHDENSCRLILKKNQDKNHKDDGMVGDEQFNGEKFQGDLRQILNEKSGLANIDQSINDNTRVTDANNNEIAMVEAIKNNGDRVVDTCVQDDTLVLGAKNGVTSDSVVPVINLESDLASNPTLPTAGVLSGKDPSLATIEDSGQANMVQQYEENLDQIVEFGGICDHDFTLKDNDEGGWTEVPRKIFSPGNTKLQQLDCTNPPRKEQTINCEDEVSKKIVCSNIFDALMINFDQELHALSTLILQVSNPETTRIIKESHATMLNKENLMIKTPIQSISKRNDKSLVKEMSDSRWADLVEEEEHAPARSKLSPQAPIFVPSSKANPSMTMTIDKSKKILTITTKVLEKSHEPEAEVSRLSPTTMYDSDLGNEMFDEDDMLDILFDKVAKDGDLSPSLTHGVSLQQVFQRWWKHPTNVYLKPLYQALPCVVVWEPWKRRKKRRYGGNIFLNKRIFQVSATLHSLLVYKFPKMKRFSSNWPELVSKLESYIPRLHYRRVCWGFPSGQWIKCNTDGASRGNPRNSGAVVVFRDVAGDFMCAATRSN